MANPVNGQRLVGRRAVVTGASRGLGFAMSRRLAAEGAAVVLVARTKEHLDDAVERLKGEGGNVHGFVGDVTSDADVDRLAAAAYDLFSGPTDLLVNNAGSYLVKSFAASSMADWSVVIDANVLSVVRVTRAFLAQLTSARTSRVINIASTGGKWPALGQAAYNTSKHALIGLTRCLALELAPAGVRVNAICPGYVATDMLDLESLAPFYGVKASELLGVLASRSPMGRLVTPEEVAELAVYLATPLADGMTGQALTLSAGTLYV